jgi:hypothetical protein
MVMEMCKKGVVMKVGLEEKADPYDCFLFQPDLHDNTLLAHFHHHVQRVLRWIIQDLDHSLYMVMEMCKKGVVMKVGLEEKADPYDDEQCRCMIAISSLIRYKGFFAVSVSSPEGCRCNGELKSVHHEETEP